MIDTLTMDILTIAGDFKPLEDLLKSVRMRGTSEEPLFNISDVANYIGDTNYNRTTKDFGPKLKVQSDYNDGKRTRYANFFTERGLYEYMLLSGRPKCEEFKEMVYDILKQVRKHIYEKMQRKIDGAKEHLSNLPLPYNDEEQAEYHVRLWLQANILDTSTSPFYRYHVSEYSYKCVYKCVKVGLYSEVDIIMKQAYDAHRKSIAIPNHAHCIKALIKHGPPVCLPENIERSWIYRPNIRPVFTEE